MPDKQIGRIKKTRWFIVLSVWWLAASGFYLAIVAGEQRRDDMTRAAGIDIAVTSARAAGMPLLERDVRALTQLVQDVARKPGVVSASIIDHKNKIIAFSDANRIIPAAPPSVTVQADGARFWTQTLASGGRAICFSADIDFAGTKIGEAFLAMDGSEESDLTATFFISAVVSLLIILVILLAIDFHGLRPLRSALVNGIRRWVGTEDSLPEGQLATCPLCGSHKPLTRSFFMQADLDRFPVVREDGTHLKTVRILQAHGIRLEDLSQRDDLGWFRRQLVHRCADIIKKIAGG